MVSVGENKGIITMWEFYFVWLREEDLFEKLVNGQKKFDGYMEVPRDVGLVLNEFLLRTLVAQFKDDD